MTAQKPMQTVLKQENVANRNDSQSFFPNKAGFCRLCFYDAVLLKEFFEIGL